MIESTSTIIIIYFSEFIINFILLYIAFRYASESYTNIAVLVAAVAAVETIAVTAVAALTAIGLTNLANADALAASLAILALAILTSGAVAEQVKK